MESTKKQPLLTPILRWFMFAMVMANIASHMSPMLMSIYLVDLGANVEQVGLVYMISSAVVMVFQIFGGWLSDSIGRLRAIAIGSIGGVFGFFGLFLAPTWQWMVVALIGSMFPSSLVGPSFGAFIAENSTEQNRGRVYGVTDTLFQITGVLGPLLGGLMVNWRGYKLMFLVSAILYALAAVLRIWMATTMKPPAEMDREPQELTTASFKSSLKTMLGMLFGGGLITWIFFTDGVRDIAFGLSGQFQSLYVNEVAGISEIQIGYLGSIFSIAMMAIPILSGKLVDKYGERVPITAGFSLIFIAMVIFLNVMTFFGFIVVWIIFGVGVGLLSPAYNSLMSKVVPKKMLGIFTGLIRSSIGFLALPAPYLGAILWENYGPQVPFIITAIVVFLTIFPVWFKFIVPKKEEEIPAAELSPAD